MCYQVRFITRSVKCMVCDGMVRKWVRMFSEGRKNVHDEARSGRPSLVNDDFVCKANERVRDDRLFTISDLSLHFPQISRTLHYDIVSSHLGRRRPLSMRRIYKNLCPATTSASIMAAHIWKNSLKNVESDNNKILYETLFNFFLQRNGTYFLNKPRICTWARIGDPWLFYEAKRGPRINDFGKHFPRTLIDIYQSLIA